MISESFMMDARLLVSSISMLCLLLGVSLVIIL